MRNPVLAIALAVCLPTATAWATTSLPQSATKTTTKPQQDPKPAAAPENIEVIALEFAQANEVAKSINRMLQLNRRSSDLVLIPHPGANAVLLRGSAKRIAHAKNLIARADVQPAFQKKGSMTQVVIIEHGKAQDLARTLNRFLQTSRGNDLRIEAHAPNNMLLLRGTKARLVDTLDLIAQLDRKPTKTPAAPRLVYLQHTKAAEVAATLNRFLDLGQADGPNRGFFIDANKPRNAVILRGDSQQVAEALNLIARIDVKTPGSEGRAMRTVVLKHAHAKDIADTLKRFAGPNTEHDIEVRYSQKENALLIQGREGKMQQVLKLIAQLDTRTERHSSKNRK